MVANKGARPEAKDPGMDLCYVRISVAEELKRLCPSEQPSVQGQHYDYNRNN